MIDYWRCKVCGIAINTEVVEKYGGICEVCGFVRSVSS